MLLLPIILLIIKVIERITTVPRGGLLRWGCSDKADFILVVCILISTMVVRTFILVVCIILTLFDVI